MFIEHLKSLKDITVEISNKQIEDRNLKHEINIKLVKKLRIEEEITKRNATESEFAHT